MSDMIDVSKAIGTPDDNVQVPVVHDAILDVTHVSKDDYQFNPRDNVWVLSKDSVVYLNQVVKRLAPELDEPLRKNLIYYAKNRSGRYTANLASYIANMLRNGKSGYFDFTSILNFKSTLDANSEYKLGYIKSFLKHWYKGPHDGIDKDAYELLCILKLKGNVKGERVQLLDPRKGPLSDIELENIHERAYQGFRDGSIHVQDLAATMILTHLGSRPIQISNLKIDDLKQAKGAQEKGVPEYYINMPSAKNRLGWRKGFHLKPITENLWDIIQDQVENVVGQCRRLFPLLTDSDVRLLPLFPDMDVIEDIDSIDELRDVLGLDVAHMSSDDISNIAKETVQSLEIVSERTGADLEYFPTRSRYTVGTNLGREGFGRLAIAEALDHSDDQNANVYIKNNPGFIRNLDETISRQLIPIAMAFAGKLVDSEAGAVNGMNISKRIRIVIDPEKAASLGTCGEHGFCTDYAPVACYTCNLFQPWLEAPHQIILEFLLAERERLYQVTGDERVSAVHDRTVHAVLNVMELCHKRKAELANNIVKLEYTFNG